MDNIIQHLFITKELEEKNGYTWTLASRLGEALNLAEQFFGDRDRSYTILGVEFIAATNSQIWYPGNRKHIVIQLTNDALFNEFQAYYQLSHEIIHLLSPSGGQNTNILEEGLATYFSEKYLSELGQSNWTPTCQKYQEALELTKTLLSKDDEIIKKVRTIEPTISKLTQEHFFLFDEKISKELLTELLKKWNDI